MILAGVDLEPAGSARSSDEYSPERNEPTDLDAEPRTLKRVGQNTARLRLRNPFQNEADEYSAERNEPSDLNAKLRTLKREGQKTARLRVTSPFQNEADAANAGRWNAAAFGARGLEQQRHQEAYRLLNGYNADSERRRHRRRQRSSLSSPGSR